MARTSTKIVIKNLILKPNHLAPAMGLATKGKGESQPPRKNSALSPDIRIMLLYSARKNRANPIAEYSTLYPETSSASASGRSKGCRFVSASVVTKKIRKIGKSGNTSQRFD